MEKTISVLEASKRYRLPFGYVTLLKRIEAGQCPAVVRVGKRFKVRPAEFEAWVQDQHA